MRHGTRSARATDMHPAGRLVAGPDRTAHRSDREFRPVRAGTGTGSSIEPLHHRIRETDQPARALAEVPEPLIVGLPAPEAVINLLDDHSQLEDAEHFVIADGAQVAARLFRI